MSFSHYIQSGGTWFQFHGGLSGFYIVKSEVAQSCPALCDPMDCSLPDFSVHGIFQARVLEWVAIPFSRGSSRPRGWTRVFCIVGRRFTLWATRKLLFFHTLRLSLMKKLTGGLQSMGSLGVGHDWATSLSLFTFMHWRRKWQPTPVFLLRESQGLGSLVGCRLWGHTESDTTEVT